jgi:hypothetical protein
MAHITTLAQSESAIGADLALTSGDIMADAALQGGGGAVRPFDARARKQFLDHLALTANVAGWHFVPAMEGLTLWVTTKGRSVRFTAGQWTEALEVSALRVGGRQVVGAQQPAIAPPSGGVNPDIQARQTISAIVSALSAHGLISN